jgi:gamma-glutamylcyclotransferase (GGCT)/AIG2-like uncharacterized protein YtfP
VDEKLIRHIFVYGTLKRGGVRQRCWPHSPVRIDEATIRAALYDLGPYPAIGRGDDLVAGEVWEIEAAHLEETLEALDVVEGFRQSDDNLYVRRLVQCQLANGRQITAWTYYFGDEAKLTSSLRIAAWP